MPVILIKGLTGGIRPALRTNQIDIVTIGIIKYVLIDRAIIFPFWYKTRIAIVFYKAEEWHDIIMRYIRPYLGLLHKRLLRVRYHY